MLANSCVVCRPTGREGCTSFASRSLRVSSPLAFRRGFQLISLPRRLPPLKPPKSETSLSLAVCWRLNPSCRSQSSRSLDRSSTTTPTQAEPSQLGSSSSPMRLWPGPSTAIHCWIQTAARRAGGQVAGPKSSWNIDSQRCLPPTLSPLCEPANKFPFCQYFQSVRYILHHPCTDDPASLDAYTMFK